jgi:hypothetical protein
MGPKFSPRARKLILGSLIVLIIAYVSFGVFIWRSMNRPPEAFAKVMSKMPGPVVFMLFPFETLWTHARAGTLNVGDVAPDFSLVTLDKTGRVQLSALNRQRPVVLIFGSYT